MKKWVMLLISFCLVLLIAAVILKYGPSGMNGKMYSKLEYNTQSGPVSYRFPGEFEKQQAIWLQWPSQVYTTGSRNVVPEMINIIKALAPNVRVNVMSVSTAEISAIKSLLKKNGYTGTNVYYYRINHLSIWARDVGPIFVKDSQNRLNIVDFGFNNYSRDGNTDYVRTESNVDKLSAQLLKLPVIKSTLVSEGGAIESNGKGTLMLVEAVAMKRNPAMTKLQIENEYKRVLGIKKIIWLKKGLAEDDAITTGHINEFARFASVNTVLLAQILPGDRYANQTSQESYRRMEENYKILKSSTDQEGKPFNIIRIPMPPTLYQEANITGKIPVRSYLNYAVTNGAVVMPTYWKTGRSDTLKTAEAEIRSIFQKTFPNRKIIAVNDENINKWGGGIHCITQHMSAY
jgi:agmatine deiminase